MVLRLKVKSCNIEIVFKSWVPCRIYRLKVSLFQEDFLVPSNSSKKRTKTFRHSTKMNLFVRFLEEFEDIKSPFEII